MKEIKLSNLLSVSMLVKISSVVLLILFCLILITNKLSNLISNICQNCELLMHVALIILSIKIYRKSDLVDKVIQKWFIITGIFFFMNDFIYYFVVYILPSLAFQNVKYILIWGKFLNNISSVFWLISLSAFFIKILIREIISIMSFTKIMFVMLLFNFILVTLFLTPISLQANLFTWHNLFLEFSLILESVIFDLAILLIIYSKNIGLLEILAGFIIIVVDEFLIAYHWIVKEDVLPHEFIGLLWFFGMILILCGLDFLDRHNKHNIKSWLYSYRRIKSKITLGAFLISFGSFLLFFICGRTLFLIDQKAFIALPIFLMISSVIMVSLSSFMGRVFEVPFKQIEGNINTILINSGKDKLDANFSIDEFIFLQKIIVDAFKSKEEQDLIRKQFGDLAAEVAHDVASPLTAMHSALSNLKKNNVGKCDIAILEKAMQSVKNITNNLLINYRSLNEIKSRSSPQEDDGNTPRYIMLAPFLANLIENKQLEWSDETCNLYLEIDPSGQMSWLYVSPQLLTRVISNLLNNAYESLDKEHKDISCKLLILNNKFQIDIQDNGGGIPQEYIQEVVLGKSLKHPGSGMGLSGAKKYLTSINGGLDISSIHKEGTCVSLNLPIAITPSWFSSQISCNIEESSFVVLDDNPSIIMLWQRVMTGFNANCKYFLKLNEFDMWFNANEDKNIIFLIDYDIRDTLTGVDIIQKYGLLDVYMFTNHAEELWLQELVIKNKFKLVPKSIISSIQIIST